MCWRWATIGAAGQRRPHGTLRFVTCIDSGAAARSTVDALTLRAVTRTLLFDQIWQSSSKRGDEALDGRA
jgi:hypothetical protein